MFILLKLKDNMLIHIDLKTKLLQLLHFENLQENISYENSLEKIKTKLDFSEVIDDEEPDE